MIPSTTIPELGQLAPDFKLKGPGGAFYTLSEHRGESVRDYLTQQGMAAASVTTKGFGKTQPVASNDTPQGRQQNRRVELVISGDIIGTEIGKVIALK